jgi:hypothetical protein
VSMTTDVMTWCEAMTLGDDPVHPIAVSHSHQAMLMERTRNAHCSRTHRCSNLTLRESTNGTKTSRRATAYRTTTTIAKDKAGESKVIGLQAQSVQYDHVQCQEKEDVNLRFFGHARDDSRREYHNSNAGGSQFA